MNESTVVRTRKPILAGIFAIICGGIEIWGSSLSIASPLSQQDIHVGVAVFMVGLIAITGGILALGRRVWGLALSGAICALLGSMLVPWILVGEPDPSLPPGAHYAPGYVWVVMVGIPMFVLGILAIEWIASSKQEFR